MPPDAVVYNAAISCAGQLRMPERALALLSEMSNQGLRPTAVSYGAAIAACEKSGEWRTALGLLDRMEKRGLQRNTAPPLLLSVSPPALSRSLLGLSLQVVFSSAISACGSGGQWQRALALLAEMAELGVEQNTITYNAAIQACERAGQWREAIRLFDAMEATGVTRTGGGGEGGREPRVHSPDLRPGGRRQARQHHLQRRRASV